MAAVTDEYIRDRSPEDYAKIQQYQADWQAARAANDQAGMTAAHDGAEAIRAKYSYSGGQDGSQYIPIGQPQQTPAQQLQAEQVDYDALAADLAAQTQASYDSYAEQMAEAQAAQEAAFKAAVDKSVSALEGQKGGVKQAGADADQAAYDAYMQIMNPNGALAEQLAARGLTNSGYSESSMVSAGNTLQTGLQENLREVNRQLHEIDLAIEQAKLTGDMQSAEQLAAYRQQVAEQGLALQQQLTSIGMWGAEQSAAQNQQNFQNALAEAELTGNYGGQQLPSAKMEELELEYYRYYLDIYKATGMSQAQAELKAAEEAAKAAQMNNQYLQGQLGY
ncbi:MAG: hypothetical protein IJW30_00485 [Clostridia bacterium]|nr:hypothetical protein [Clostridia bacterium]